ncbi:MAG: L,D-transpeptidase family protein [Lachnospiraceae bacterium]|nr:L,D-transpeptidase family protein [Lachnospiraceae bacterium]
MSDTDKAVNKKWTKKKVVIWTVLPLLAVGLIVGGWAYGVRVRYYIDHFYSGTIVNGIDCSDLTLEEAAELLQERINTWELTVLEREGVTETINAEDISMTYTNDGTLADLFLAQQPLLWGYRIFQSNEHEVPTGFSYSEEKLRSRFENFQQVQEYVPVKDAEILENEDGTYRLDPEVIGTEMDQEAAYEALAEAVESQSAELDLEEYYLNPEVYEEDLQEELEEKNAIARLTRAVILIQFNEEQITLDEEILKDWLIEDKEERYKIDENKLREFVQGLYDTYNAGRENQLFKTKNGRVLLDFTTFEANGWNIDVDRSCERYLKAIQEGYRGVLGPVMTRQDAEGNVLTDTYVEISIDEQTMWLIVDGEVQLETPVVTGGADESQVSNATTEFLISDFNSRSTPSNGIWTIKKKQSPHLMKGPMTSYGTYEYTLQVTYWLPFNDQVGIHDNYQRVDYGGKIYQTNGSHGCINTPYDAVEEIYNTVEVGTMVVVYGEDTGEAVFLESSEEEQNEAAEIYSSCISFV